MLHGLGGALPADVWHDLTAAGMPRAYEPGDLLIRQGDPGSHVLVLLYGRVKVLRDEADGSRLLLALRAPGEILGEMAVLDDEPRSATVIAIDRCVVRVLTAREFTSRVNRTGLHIHVIRHVMRRHRESEDLRAELAGLPTARRLARMLLRLNDLMASPNGDPAGLPLTQEELALMIGVSRSAVTAELRAWRLAGIVDTARGQVTVRNATALRRISDGSGDVSTSGQS